MSAPLCAEHKEGSPMASRSVTRPSTPARPDKLSRTLGDVLARAVLPGDLPLEPQALATAAQFLLAAAAQRKSSAPSITLESVSGSVTDRFMRVAVINDDMPFLVDSIAATFAAQGLTILAPTQRYGYVANRAPASPADELAYIRQVRRDAYPWLDDAMVPVSGEVFTRYGVSTTPTLVFIRRDGTVLRYNPGQMTRAQIEPLIQDLVTPQ